MNRKPTVSKVKQHAKKLGLEILYDSEAREGSVYDPRAPSRMSIKTLRSFAKIEGVKVNDDVCYSHISGNEYAVTGSFEIE